VVSEGRHTVADVGSAVDGYGLVVNRLPGYMSTRWPFLFTDITLLFSDGGAEKVGFNYLKKEETI